MLSRKSIQEKINLLRGETTIKLVDLQPLISSWLDTQSLGFDGLSQDFIKQKLLDDLNSYLGVEI